MCVCVRGERETDRERERERERERQTDRQREERQTDREKRERERERERERGPDIHMFLSMSVCRYGHNLKDWISEIVWVCLNCPSSDCLCMFLLYNINILMC